MNHLDSKIKRLGRGFCKLYAIIFVVIVLMCVIVGGLYVLKYNIPYILVKWLCSQSLCMAYVGFFFAGQLSIICEWSHDRDYYERYAKRAISNITGMFWITVFGAIIFFTIITSPLYLNQ